MIIDELLASGRLSRRQHIANLELGNEVQQGSETAVIRDHAVHVE